jgi:hypothetical protein
MANGQFDNTNTGTFFLNDKKTTQNHPDYKGRINIRGEWFWISGWKKMSNGNPFVSIAIEEMTPDYQAKYQAGNGRPQQVQQAQQAQQAQQGGFPQQDGYAPQPQYAPQSQQAAYGQPQPAPRQAYQPVPVYQPQPGGIAHQAMGMAPGQQGGGFPAQAQAPGGFSDEIPFAPEFR